MESCEIVERNDALFQDLKKYPQNSKEYRDIESEIVKTNLRLVTHIAKRYFSCMGPTLSSDDLIADGYLGLLAAIKLFKPEKAVPFANYAGLWIKAYILRHIKREQKHNLPSLQDDILTGQNNVDKLKLEDVLASPVNIEEDFAEKDETERQMAWVKNNFDHLSPAQKKILNLKYFSGERGLTTKVVAKKLNCTRQNISHVENEAINKLRKLYDESHTPKNAPKEEIELTNEEKIKTKEVLKNLIATELAPLQKKTMLCKFYSPTPKTNEQVAEEIGSTQQNVAACVSASYQKLCTLCDSIKDTKHLKNILEFRVAESGKEC